MRSLVIGLRNDNDPCRSWVGGWREKNMASKFSVAMAAQKTRLHGLLGNLEYAIDQVRLEQQSLLTRQQ